MDEERKNLLLKFARGFEFKSLIDTLDGWDILNDEFEELNEEEKEFVEREYK